MVRCKVPGGCRRLQRGPAPLLMDKTEGFNWVDILESDPHSYFGTFFDAI
jgi:hypothetical protein